MMSAWGEKEATLAAFLLFGVLRPMSRWGGRGLWCHRSMWSSSLLSSFGVLGINRINFLTLVSLMVFIVFLSRPDSFDAVVDFFPSYLGLLFGQSLLTFRVWDFDLVYSWDLTLSSCLLLTSECLFSKWIFLLWFCSFVLERGISYFGWVSLDVIWESFWQPSWFYKEDSSLIEQHPIFSGEYLVARGLLWLASSLSFWRGRLPRGWLRECVAVVSYSRMPPGSFF